MPFDIFDTYYMAGMVQEIVPVQSFFRDRYFPTNAATDIFNANKVLVEYRDRDRAMAPLRCAPCRRHPRGPRRLRDSRVRAAFHRPVPSADPG